MLMEENQRRQHCGQNPQDYVTLGRWARLKMRQAAWLKGYVGEFLGLEEIALFCCKAGF